MDLINKVDESQLDVKNQELKDAEEELDSNFDKGKVEPVEEKV
ncbi:hypothetical protein [Candidatus Mycoplasma haematohominis]